MQAIFSLVKHDGTRRIHHLVGDFGAAMRGKTVKKNGAGRGVREQRGVHLVRRKNGGAGTTPLIHSGLAHACPHVAV